MIKMEILHLSLARITKSYQTSSEEPGGVEDHCVLCQIIFIFGIESSVVKTVAMIMLHSYIWALNTGFSAFTVV